MVVVAVAFFVGGCGTMRDRGDNRAVTDEGVVINGVRWATRNVDAPGTFAESPESAGMFFQWSRKKGWYATDEIMREGWDIRSSFTSTIWDTEWYAENDPCPEGWRIPTRRELEQLRRANSEWTSKNGVYGRLFGTAPNQIFLPAAKFLTTSGNIGWHLGNHGSYWSRTQDSRNRDSVAWRFTFSESDYLWVNAMHKALGFNIRCVSIN
jgi:uncharacterized protein (TIGR02145 family)